MRKFLDVLEIILFWFWLIGLILLHIGVIGVIKNDFPEHFFENLVYAVIGIAIWWGIMIGVSKLFKLKDRHYERKRTTTVWNTPILCVPIKSSLYTITRFARMC